MENEGTFCGHSSTLNICLLSDVDTRVSSECVNVNLIPKHSPLIRPGSVLFSDILNRDMIDH